MQHQLRIPTDKLRYYLKRYDASADQKLEDIQLEAKSKGYMTKEQLHRLAQWKSPRRANLTLDNPEPLVQEITTFAFAAKHEVSRIGALVLLNGVQYPTASVILHFCVDESYPILDFRAIYSLGLKQPYGYTPSYWINYVEICRKISQSNGLSVRELDMALWQYSREHQQR